MGYAYWNEYKESGGELKERDRNDFYPTSPEDVQKCLSVVNKTITEKDSFKVLDIGYGTGVWGEGLYDDRFFQRTKQNFSTVGVDIQNFNPNKFYDECYTEFDFLEYGNVDALGKFDLIIANPPFKHAQEIIELAHELLNDDGQIVMLLRLAFLESQRRNEFFKLYKPDEVRVFSKRPSFTGDGKTYPMAFATFSWLKNYSGDTKLTWSM